MSDITITCAHCGAATCFDAATDGLPMDHFRCCSCGKVWKRCHGKPEFCEAGTVNQLQRHLSHEHTEQKRSSFSSLGFPHRQ